MQTVISEKECVKILSKLGEKYRTEYFISNMKTMYPSLYRSLIEGMKEAFQLGRKQVG